MRFKGFTHSSKRILNTEHVVLYVGCRVGWPNNMEGDWEDIRRPSAIVAHWTRLSTVNVSDVQLISVPESSFVEMKTQDEDANGSGRRRR